MTPEEAAFIAAVTASPDADLPRLVYADWLDEHGHAARARLIRLQCEIEALRREEAGLLRDHHNQLTNGVILHGADRCAFHRGFPEELSVTATNLLRGWREIAARTPLRHLHVKNATDRSLRDLAHLPALSSLRSLELDYGPDTGLPTGEYGIDGVAALADSSHLSGLRRLTLHSRHIGEDGARRIADSPTFSNLTHLTLSDPAFQRSGHRFVRELVGSPHLGRLERLQLGDAAFPAAVLPHPRRAGRSPGRSPS